MKLKFGWLVAVLLMIIAQPAAAARVALVIGNATYQHTSRLANPGNDAADVSTALRSAGFAVDVVTDAGKSRMEQALSAFAGKAAGSEMAVLFYAGHGMELNGQNYLIPVDAKLESEAVAALQTVRLNDVMDIVGASRLGIVFLDACRDNPLVNNMTRRSGTRSAFRGLARIEPIDNLQVVYAARDGSRAADGTGRNSPFTTALLQGLKTPGLEIRDLWGEVRTEVLRMTNRQQEPFVYGPPLSGRFYFTPPSPGMAAAPAQAISLDPELLAFQAARRAGSEATWRQFVQSYPNSAYAATANIELAALARPRPQPQPPQAQPSVQQALPRAVLPTAAAGTNAMDCPECPEMVKIPGGSFRMGDLSGKGFPHEKPVRGVQVSSFWVGKYEVTFDEWDACYAAGGCSKRPDDERGWGRGRRPVINVSWEDTQQYVQWLSRKTGKRYRLLSEAEWEYVARGGTSTEFSFGDCIHNDRANYDGNYHFLGCGRTGVYLEKTQPVGSYAANPWGLHDVHGNVWEWVQDCWEAGYAGGPTDGSALTSGDCSQRVLRGGSWFYQPIIVRSASRNGGPPKAGDITVGFRLAKSD